MKQNTVEKINKISTLPGNHFILVKLLFNENVSVSMLLNKAPKLIPQCLQKLVWSLI